MKVETEDGTDFLKKSTNKEIKPNQNIIPPKCDMVTEGYNPDDKTILNQFTGSSDINPDHIILPKLEDVSVKKEIVKEGLFDSADKYRSAVNHTTKLEEIKERRITNSFESNWMKIVNSIKKHLSLMIIFILLGCACGVYIAKFIYDIRMDEIAQLAKTGSAGYIHKGQIFDVKLRP